MARGVKARDTNCRTRVWSGGSMLNKIDRSSGCRASGLSGAGTGGGLKRLARRGLTTYCGSRRTEAASPCPVTTTPPIAVRTTGPRWRSRS